MGGVRPGKCTKCGTPLGSERIVVSQFSGGVDGEVRHTWRYCSMVCLMEAPEKRGWWSRLLGS